MSKERLKVIQVLPALESGGVERGTLELGAYLVAHGHENVVISAGGRMVAQLEREGSRHIAMAVGRKRLGTLLLVRRLRRILEAEKPDILHVRSRLPAWIAWLAWRRMDPATRPHLVCTFHGFYSAGWYSGIMTRGERVIAVSDSVRGYILENWPSTPADRLRVIHRGVDPAAYPVGYMPPEEWQARWRGQHPAAQGRWILTLPGRITRLKGHGDFIAILKALKAEGIPVHGLVAGGAEEKKRAYFEEIKALALREGLGHETLTWLGHRSDMREVMAMSDVVLSLSSQPESFGRTTLEALAIGRPVLGYDHGGVGEQLRLMLPSGLVPLGDIPGVLARLRQWHAEAPVPAANETFTLERMCSQTLAVYRELVP